MLVENAETWFCFVVVDSFQCILNAATSPATKVNEETLTYLNQGKSYELRLKKLGDISQYEGKLLKVRWPIFVFVESF